MIHYFFEDIQAIDRIEENSKWIEKIIISEKKKLGKLSFVFCSDAYLLKVNQDYLQHDYYTDIISFDYTKGRLISGDIFISLQRVKENSETLQTTFKKELQRVLAHGILHYCGYNDKTEEEKEMMREKENQYINLNENQ